MKYEIIKDKEDLLVLVSNNIVLAVSRDMSKIIDILQEDYSLRSVNYMKRYNPAIIDTEATTKEVQLPTNRIPAKGSLGKLLELEW